MKLARVRDEMDVDASLDDGRDHVDDDVTRKRRKRRGSGGV